MSVTQTGPVNCAALPAVTDAAGFIVSSKPPLNASAVARIGRGYASDVRTATAQRFRFGRESRSQQRRNEVSPTRTCLN